MLGGPIIAGATLSRFFALHVFVIPGMLMLFVGLHVLLVLKLGINEWPMPGRLVRRSDYLEKYHALTHTDGVPFVPYGVWKDAVFSGVILLCHCGVCVVFRSLRPERPARSRGSSRRRHARISSSCGFTRFYRCFRQRWKLRFC